MGLLFDNAKKLVNKVSDSINRNKWDLSSVNLALYEDAEASRQAEEEEKRLQTLESADFSNFEAQVREVNERMKAEQESETESEPASLGIALAPIPCIAPRKSAFEKPSVKEDFLEKKRQEEESKKALDIRLRRHTFSYSTAKVVDKGGSELVSLSNLPTVDSSQSIFSDSRNTEKKLFGGTTEVFETDSIGEGTVQIPEVKVAEDKGIEVKIPETKASEIIKSDDIMRNTRMVQEESEVQPAVTEEKSFSIFSGPKVKVVEPEPVKIEEAKEEDIDSKISFAPNDETTKAITESKEVTKVEPKEEINRVPNEDGLVINGDICYYVKITHEKTYPAVGSVNIMRACDNEYVWQDSLPESEIPTYDVCKRCGRKIGHTAIKMD